MKDKSEKKMLKRDNKSEIFCYFCSIINLFLIIRHKNSIFRFFLMYF